jgi:hypothetical protein
MFELVHRGTAFMVGQFATAGDAIAAYDRIRTENPGLARELLLVTPDEGNVIAHAALEFGQ